MPNGPVPVKSIIKLVTAESQKVAVPVKSAVGGVNTNTPACPETVPTHPGLLTLIKV